MRHLLLLGIYLFFFSSTSIGRLGTWVPPATLRTYAQRTFDLCYRRRPSVTLNVVSDQQNDLTTGDKARRPCPAGSNVQIFGVRKYSPVTKECHIFNLRALAFRVSL